MVVIVVAVAVVVVLLDVGLNPSEKPVAAPVVAAGAVEAGAEVVAAAADPRGLSMKDKPPPAAVVVALPTEETGVAPKVKPVAGAVEVGADVVTGRAKRLGPTGTAAWVDAGGAGVDEGLIPKLNPPP